MGKLIALTNDDTVLMDKSIVDKSCLTGLAKFLFESGIKFAEKNDLSEFMNTKGSMFFKTRKGTVQFVWSGEYSDGAVRVELLKNFASYLKKNKINVRASIKDNSERSKDNYLEVISNGKAGKIRFLKESISNKKHPAILINTVIKGVMSLCREDKESPVFVETDRGYEVAASDVPKARKYVVKYFKNLMDKDGLTSDEFTIVEAAFNNRLPEVELKMIKKNKTLFNSIGELIVPFMIAEKNFINVGGINITPIKFKRRTPKTIIFPQSSTNVVVDSYVEFTDKSKLPISNKGDGKSKTSSARTSLSTAMIWGALNLSNLTSTPLRDWAKAVEEVNKITVEGKPISPYRLARNPISMGLTSLTFLYERGIIPTKYSALQTAEMYYAGYNLIVGQDKKYCLTEEMIEEGYSLLNQLKKELFESFNNESMKRILNNRTPYDTKRFIKECNTNNFSGLTRLFTVIMTARMDSDPKVFTDPRDLNQNSKVVADIKNYLTSNDFYQYKVSFEDSSQSSPISFKVSEISPNKNFEIFYEDSLTSMKINGYIAKDGIIKIGII